MDAYPAKLGIVAGGGYLPKRLIEFCDEKGISVFLIGFDGQTDKSLLNARIGKMMRLGEAGTIVKILKEQGINDLVLIGSIKRPSIKDLRPDLYTVGFFAGIGFRALGDDGLLKAIRRKLEGEGFNIHGIHELIPELLAPSRTITVKEPTVEQWASIKTGMTGAKELGFKDAGQAVVVRDSHVILREDQSGTDELIKKSGSNNKGDILVKMCKPQQDRKLDLPTIGPRTVALCAKHGYAGIAVEAGSVLLVDEAAIRRLADASGIFVVGV